ncbi:spermidine synthase [Plasmodium ovale wallikeri]|uniref:Spermidine synthase n=1 Tax=Plasmodium ovale wallikeri TaxID=864142 RepID=A0A1A8YWK7_PLAOA|nr:spermidine synthase [Plasmodium ovale wallikeri]
MCLGDAVNVVKIFESTTFGNVLVLDGVIQLTEKDEFAYHEMMTHIPMTVAKEPKNILVVGGGDGGVIRELCKYKSVENIDICEIDEMVIEVSKTYFKNISSGFEDKRVNVFIEDASKFLENVTNTYDVIIVDSSDPIGPAETLFNQSFYEKVYNALKPNGYCVAQVTCSVCFYVPFVHTCGVFTTCHSYILVAYFTTCHSYILVAYFTTCHSYILVAYLLRAIRTYLWRTYYVPFVHTCGVLTTFHSYILVAFTDYVPFLRCALLHAFPSPPPF